MTVPNCDIPLTFSERLDEIEDEIANPRRVSEDGVDATARSAEEIIRLASYTASSRRMARGLGACINQTIRPPDGTGSNRGS